MQNHVLDYLYDVVKEKPKKVAYCDDNESLTFEEVYWRSRSIGSYLYKKNVYKKPIVVFMKKSPSEVTAFFGAIMGGNFYVPIDEDMPDSRIRLILENVYPPVMICDKETVKSAKEIVTSNCEIVLYDEMIQEDTDTMALEWIYQKSLETDPIYIVFTSGTTGMPKGVTTSHRAVIDYIEQLSEILGFNENTVFGNQAPLYVDACLKEIYPTIKFGAITYFIPKKYFSFPVALVEYLNSHRINTICWVVSALTMISGFDTFRTVKPKYLHTIAFGSEIFPVKQFKIWRDALPEAVFTNLYGPTETTGMCCYYRVERKFEDNEMIPIGYPFPNREILLITEEGMLAEGEKEGEICIRGPSLALGYYNDHERTKNAFIQNPLNSAYPEKIYKTGDIGRYNERGELVFISRKDYQIKHMGHRIELGEIEVNAAAIDGIQRVACIYNENNKKIVLYFMGKISDKDLMKELRKKLPRYMLPNEIKYMDEIPLTPNGKVNRKALMEIDVN